MTTLINWIFFSTIISFKLRMLFLILTTFIAGFINESREKTKNLSVIEGKNHMLARYYAHFYPVKICPVSSVDVI